MLQCQKKEKKERHNYNEIQNLKIDNNHRNLHDSPFFTEIFIHRNDAVTHSNIIDSIGDYNSWLFSKFVAFSGKEALDKTGKEKLVEGIMIIEEMTKKEGQSEVKDIKQISQEMLHPGANNSNMLLKMQCYSQCGAMIW